MPVASEHVAAPADRVYRALADPVTTQRAGDADPEIAGTLESIRRLLEAEA